MWLLTMQRFKNLCWGIVDLPCWVSFSVQQSTASHSYTYTYLLFFRFFPHIGHYRVSLLVTYFMYSSVGFPGGSEVKASAFNAGDLGLIPGSGRSPGEGNGNPLQYSCLENPMDRGDWWATVHRAAKSWTRLRDFTHFTHTYIYSFLDFIPI